MFLLHSTGGPMQNQMDELLIIGFEEAVMDICDRVCCYSGVGEYYMAM